MAACASGKGTNGQDADALQDLSVVPDQYEGVTLLQVSMG